MNYEETLQYLYNRLPVFQHVGASAYKPGLGNSLALDDYFGHPHRAYRTIHIAGTNGKGSTSHLLAAILQQSGYKVGLYTSPHLVDFRERIRVNGEMISKDYVIDFTRQYIDHASDIKPSFFELTMMMAFHYFKQQNVQVAIIEVGLGGRLDSTNVITPDLSVITNISFDHMQFLGDTLAKIAYEKAGIMKPEIPVVIGEAEGEVKEVFIQHAAATGTPLFFAANCHPIKEAKLDSETGKWLFQSETYPHLIGELGGFCQEKNAATVLTSIQILKERGYSIPDRAVYSGFARVIELTGLQGRWQTLQHSPKIVCDTGHNTGGFSHIVPQLEQQCCDTLRIVIGMVNDKDITGVLKMLPRHAVYYFTQASVVRALPCKEVRKEASVFGLQGDCYANVAEAYEQAKKESSANDFIYIGGSSFIVADLLTYLNGQR